MKNINKIKLMFDFLKRLLQGHWVLAGIVPTLAILMLGFTVYSVSNKSNPVIIDPKITPPSTTLKHKIAGLGVIEAASQNLEIATPIPGIILKMNQHVGAKVKAGDILCVIDDREILSQLDSIKASLDMAKIDAQEKQELAKRYARVKDNQAVSQEIRSKIKYASKTADAKVKMLEAEIQKLEVTLERVHVKAPISGEILYINKRPGEYASPNHPLLILGDTEILNVRVEFDETEAFNIKPSAKALGQLRGYTKDSIPLRFERKEAMLRPKKQFVGDGLERYDTRVQEVVYTFITKPKEAFVGQQIEVFVERDLS